MPTVRSIKRIRAIAGRVTYSSVIEYPDEKPYTVYFHGNEPEEGYATTVVMQYDSGVAGNVQVWVRNPDRFGVPFGKEWVKRFLEDGR
jgi:hypothetical protein